tara:strand:- start:126 stop:566 length:441 start_codon:yes stop_codon:yes gene_type:complete
MQGKKMANDLLKKLEEKINEAIETIELSRMEVSDLKEQNEELENRYADWETRLSTLIEKFEQLEESEDNEIEEELNTNMQASEEGLEAEVASSEEDLEAEVESADTLYADNEDLEDSFNDEEELGSTFDTNVDSLNESAESSQHYA